MSKDRLLERTKNILTIDRLALMRENADQQNTYCFFASMYEAAYHIHADKAPPRYKEAEEQWLSFGVGSGVSPERMYNLVIELANKLEIKIDKIYANPGTVPQFLKDKVSDTSLENVNEIEEVENTKKKIKYSAHAESQTFINRSAARIEMATNNGWQTVMVISFSNEPYKEANNTSESVPIELVSGKSITLPYPYVLVMLKEDTSGTDS